jgi:hypothetical protein
MSKPIREAFFSRLQSALYVYIKSHKMFKDWETSELYMIAGGLLNEKTNEINEYLDRHQFTVANQQKAVEEIMERILVPELENQRI